MKLPLRTAIFWLHLGSGITAGLIIALMSVTGAAVAFEPQLLEWAEAGSRRVTPPQAGAPRLGPDELLARARAASPGAAPVALTIYADPAAAARVSTGRDTGLHVDPYNGAVRALDGQGWRSFFRVMIEWHRYLGTSADNRAVGKAITGACNAAFLFLALTGLYLWWPRKLTGRVLRTSLWFRRGLGSGKARDFNWHNVIGFWSLPVLIVVTSSGMMISYRWVNNLIYTLAGEPAPGPGPAPAAPPVRVPPPPAGARPLGLDGLLAAVGREVPAWKSATIRLRAPQREGAVAGRERGGAGAGGGGGAGRGERGAQALALTVKDPGAWPRFASAQLTLDPYTGGILRKETYADYGPGRKARSWMRFLHTGEALGWPGQLVAAVVSLAVTLLAWTGLALAFRRLFRRGVPVRGQQPAPLPGDVLDQQAS